MRLLLALPSSTWIPCTVPRVASAGSLLKRCPRSSPVRTRSPTWCLHTIQLRTHWSGSRSPLDILGVAKDATEAEIKKKYFDLARKCHPDIYTGDDAKQQFQEISNAYAFLMDEEQRQSYQTATRGKTEMSAREVFEAIFRDRRLKTPNLAVEERALYACMEKMKGNEEPTRDFVVDYRLPPQFFLPKPLQLESKVGTEARASQFGHDDSRASVSDFFSKSPIGGGG
eukprot:gnl/TRDRNA2_/TRDRNA2_43769_c0_seq1.p2 gnl/TRDRNA2_/TRDRNA2_43769_c0~~gnl/TRDRNA2_/TRDRNA2_43769_c0_seq1.p2  ORF type:complete len:227 (-),score=37.86 gnl/TRDRNA2_/TRDRNA2_43769_c0_seq1:202-882(-)